MKLTEALKKWLVDNCDVEKDAADDDFRKAAGIAMAEWTRQYYQGGRVSLPE